jgi:hypothetical protein
VESKGILGQDSTAAVTEHVVFIQRGGAEVAFPTFAPPKWGLIG